MTNIDADIGGDGENVRTELSSLLVDEFNAAGIPCRLIAQSQIEDGDGSFTMPAQIAVPLDTDECGRTPEARIYFLPVFDNPPVMQYMVFLDYDVVDEALADLARFVALLNAQLTITGFEMSEAMGQVVFRHSHTVDPSRIDPGVIAWPLSVIRETVATHGPLIEHVANGKSFDEAVAMLSALV